MKYLLHVMSSMTGLGGAAAMLPLVASLSCSSTEGGGGGSDDAYDDIAQGTIAYPFVDETKSLGEDGPQDKFIIKSAVGDKEYQIEIPGAARDYDVQIPLAAMGDAGGDDGAGTGPGGKKLANPVNTDREMVNALPRLDRERPTDSALMDSAFGVGNAEGPKQAPSYTLGLAKINAYYKARQYEYALVEINQQLAFYPNSPQLNKMKGSVLLKMRNLPLAELAWIKALELDPNDKAVRAALTRLQKRITAAGKAVAGPPKSGPPEGVPAAVGTAAPKVEPALTH